MIFDIILKALVLAAYVSLIVDMERARYTTEPKQIDGFEPVTRKLMEL